MTTNQILKSDGHPIGFVGLGNLGEPMARSLLRDGWPVAVYDVRREAADRLAAYGAEVVDSPDGLRHCEVVGVAVPDDEAVLQVLVESGLLDNLSAEAVVLIHSTVLPATMRQLADEADARGVVVLDAPVSGGASRAETGELTIMVGGSKEGLDRAESVLSTLASDVMHVGPSGAGAAVKLANQLVMFASLAGAYEGLEFAQRHGASVEATLQALSTSTGDTWVTRNWGFFESLVHTYDSAGVPVRYRPYSKDLWDLVQAARSAELTLPVTGLLAQVITDMVERSASKTRT